MDTISTQERRRLAHVALVALQAWQASEPRLYPTERTAVESTELALAQYEVTGV